MYQTVSSTHVARKMVVSVTSLGIVFSFMIIQMLMEVHLINYQVKNCHLSVVSDL